MTYGTGPQAVKNHLEANWQATRTGRPDVPDVVSNPETDFGVHVVMDREKVAEHHGVHDLVHCYHPEASALSFQDRGYNEKNTVEEVQVDIEVTDRTDQDSGERLYARERMVGDRGDAAFPDSEESGPYPGVLGEAVYVLEAVRRGFEEWDVSRVDVLSLYLGNSDASASLSVELEHLASNTRT